jgi:hypothetical protein
VHPGDLLSKLFTASETRQPDLAQVELDVEVGVVDPVREAETQRYAHQPLPQLWREVQAWLQHLPNAVKAQLTARCAGRVQHEQRPHVPNVVADST